MKTKTRHVVIAGGGTGGHITPALAVADELKQLDYRVTFIGSLGGPEKELIEAAGYQFYGVQAGKLRRYFSWQNVTDVIRVGVGFFQARNQLARLKPDVVFAKGGYVSLPVAYAAAFLEIPIVAHESDVVMGLANRLASEKASLICTGFPIQVYPKPLRPKLRFTGNPVRQLFLTKLPSRKELLEKYKLSASRPVVLVTGGSQGAHALNQLVIENLAANLEQFQLIHLTGEADVSRAEQIKTQLPAALAQRYRPFAFVDAELPELIALADIVVARSGANTIAELANLGKATVLIPLPTAASDHQRANAAALKKKGAAVVLEQSQVTPKRLTEILTKLLADKAKRSSLSRSIRLFSSPQAAAIAAEAIAEVARQSRN